MSRPVGEIETPAIVSPAHSQDRELSTVAGSPRGWRKLSPLQSAYEQGKLRGGNSRYQAIDRYEAGKIYERHFDLSQTSGRNMLDLDRGFGSSGGSTLGQAQIDAIRALVTIESNLGTHDRTIIRKVCGEGGKPAEAVSFVAGADYKDAVLARFREALDALIQAIEVARKHPRRVNMEVRP